MIHIKRFIDKVSAVDGRQGKDVTIPIADARGLRDELAKLILDQLATSKNKQSTPEVIEIQMTGGKF